MFIRIQPEYWYKLKNLNFDLFKFSLFYSSHADDYGNDFNYDTPNTSESLQNTIKTSPGEGFTREITFNITGKYFIKKMKTLKYFMLNFAIILVSNKASFFIPIFSRSTLYFLFVRKNIFPMTNS